MSRMSEMAAEQQEQDNLSGMDAYEQWVHEQDELARQQWDEMQMAIIDYNKETQK